MANVELGITPEQVRSKLAQVMDPELNVDLVSLGLIYDITVKDVQREDGSHPMIHILMTLTTPGCPLAGVFDRLVKDALSDLVGVNVEQDIFIELTFDPPWIPDMMSAEAKAELGFD